MNKYIYINTRTASKKDLKKLAKDKENRPSLRIYAKVTKNGSLSLTTDF
jgi:hypothetical protein